MDYNIRGRKAIVCASSQGLGKGCALALAREGVDLVVNARSRETLETTAEEIRRETGVRVTAIAADITSPEGRAAVLAACPEPDILVNNAGGPPIGDFRDWDEKTWGDAVNANMITPIMLIRAVVDGMIARRFGRIVNITSRSVKAPLPDLGLSNGARAGLPVLSAVSRDRSRSTTSRSTICCPARSRPLAPSTACASARRRSVRTTRRLPRRAAPRCRPDASARRTSSAALVRSCAARTPASSLARTC